MYNNFLENRTIKIIHPRLDCYDATFISDRLHKLFYAESWQDIYEDIYEEIYLHIGQATLGLDASRRALWHAKFFLLKIGPLDFRNGKPESGSRFWDFLTKIIQDFLMEHDPRDVPPFLRRQLFQCIEKCELVVTSSSHSQQLDNAIRLFYELHPGQGILFLDLPTAVEGWRYRLHVSGSYLLQIPTEPQGFDGIVDWWGNYDDLEEVLLVNPELPAPITFVVPGMWNTKCITIQCLLENVTRILSEGRLQRNDERLWKALARTIASNFLYFGKLNFGTHALSTEWFGQKISPNASLDTQVIMQQLANCGLTYVFQFVDDQGFLPTPSDTSQIQAIPKPMSIQTFACIVIICFLSLSMLLAYLLLEPVI
jgi:hypothetical protein